MNIVAYTEAYAEAVKDLLTELQAYIVSLDREGYNLLTEDFREAYFKETMEAVRKEQGRILLAEAEGNIVGLIAGVVREAEQGAGFSLPRRGRILELVVAEPYRSAGVGTRLLEAMERSMREDGCRGVMIGVFGYNEKAQKFYAGHGYTTRMLDVMKEF